MNEAPSVRGLSDAEQQLFAQMWGQLRATERDNNLRSAFYGRKRSMRRFSPIIPPFYFKLGLRLGWAAKGIDALDRRCKLDDFTWSDGDLSSLGSEALWAANDMRQTFNLGSLASLQHGPSFMIVTKGGAGEPEAVVSVKDALDCTGVWNARRRSLDALLSITGRDNESLEPSAAVLYLDGATVELSAAGGWHVDDRQEHYLGVPGELLAYRPEIRAPFGRSRITRAVMGHIDAGVRALIRMEPNADAYSIPQLFFLGPNDSDDFSDDGTTAPAMRNVVGRVRFIPDDIELADDGNSLARAAIEQISTSSPQPNIDLLRTHAAEAAKEMNVPEPYFVSGMANPTSADSLFIQDLPLIEEAESATDGWSPPLTRTWLKTLQCANGLKAIPDEWQSIRPVFHSPAYASRAAAADAGTKIAAVIPGFAETGVGLEMMGLSRDQIERFQDEQRRNRGSSALQSLIEQAPVEDVSESGDGSGNGA